MKKIECVYIVCYRGDLHLTRPLVASIRRWYPDVPISLIKDEMAGAFSTREIEKALGVSVLKTERTQFGWAWAKLEPLFLPGRQRYLILDSDILFAGPVLGLLEEEAADFVVSREEQTEPRSDFMRRTYYDFDGLVKWDPNFKFPGFTFNCGQIVGTSGIVNRDDFKGLLDWNGRLPKPVRPDIFPLNEQSIMNYLLVKKAQNGEITLNARKFMVWPKSPEAAELDASRITHGEGYPLLIHWAGLQNPSFGKMLMGGLLLHYEREYYSRLNFGGIKRLWRYCHLRCWLRWRRLKRQLGLAA